MKFGFVIGAALSALVLGAGTAQAQSTKVVIGMSGWTGFAPITLAKEAGLFEKNGLDVDIKMIPQKDRQLAIASGGIQCAATTVETFMIWNANGVAIKQLFQLDMSHGADGMVVRNDTKSIADLKGKTIAASAPGTSPYFLLAWMLNENGLSLDDVEVANLEPSAAAQAFLAGQNDAAMTYEPYLSTVRDKGDAGKIIATTKDYPVVMDTIGCTPDLISSNPEAVKALAKSYYDALGMIANEKDKAYKIMGADVNQSGEEFGKSAAYLEWPGKDASEKFMTDGIEDFYSKTGPLLKKIGIIKDVPETSSLVDKSWMQ